MGRLSQNPYTPDQVTPKHTPGTILIYVSPEEGSSAYPISKTTIFRNTNFANYVNEFLTEQFTYQFLKALDILDAEDKVEKKPIIKEIFDTLNTQLKENPTNLKKKLEAAIAATQGS